MLYNFTGFTGPLPGSSEGESQFLWEQYNRCKRVAANRSSEARMNTILDAALALEFPTKDAIETLMYQHRIRHINEGISIHKKFTLIDLVMKEAPKNTALITLLLQMGASPRGLYEDFTFRALR